MTQPIQNGESGASARTKLNETIAKANTAVQPADIGTAAAANIGDFATAAQGSAADTALQPGAEIPWADVTSTPSTFPPEAHTHALADLTQSSATTGQVPTWDGSAWVPETPDSGGDVSIDGTPTSGQYALWASGTAIGGQAGVPWTDLTGVPAFGDAALADIGTGSGDVAAGDHGHDANEITGLATVATSGAYADLSGVPGTFNGSTPGLVPNPGSGSADRFLRADGAFVEPPGAGGGGSVGWTDVTDKPGWTSTFDGGYASLTGLPTLGTSAALDVGTTAGTVASGDDSRLSDAREWTADTVSQAEAEAGTATTRRAWTAQRVRQAVVAAGVTVDFATVEALSGDWRGEGAETLATATAALQSEKLDVPEGEVGTKASPALTDDFVILDNADGGVPKKSPLGAPLANRVIGDGITHIVALTQAAYDALDPPDPATLYVVTGAGT